MKQNLAFYSMRGDKVIVHFNPFNLQDMVYSEDILQAAIDNITRNKDDYATEEAWRDRLAVYEGAMKFLKGDQR